MENSGENLDFRSTLEDRRSLAVRVTGGKPLLITFAGLPRHGGSSFEFSRSAAGLDIDLILVRDLTGSFYHRGIDGLGRTFPEIAESLSTYASHATRTVTIGNSAGGLMSIVMGCMIGASEVLAFSPITSIKRFQRFLYHERRWKENVQRVPRNEPTVRPFLDAAKLVAAHPMIPVQIHFPRDLRIDRIHAQRLSRFPNVTLHPYPWHDHFVIRQLRDSGQLREILVSSLGLHSRL